MLLALDMETLPHIMRDLTTKMLYTPAHAVAQNHPDTSFSALNRLIDYQGPLGIHYALLSTISAHMLEQKCS